MSEDALQTIDDAPEAPAPPRRKRWRVLAALAAVLGLVLLLGWCNRTSIADRFVAGQLEDLGLPGTYTVEKVSTNRQILTNL
ncbi:MAG: hypothetical protein ABL914_12515, partial [Novosphingobium sp.]|uniref:hypothetical protein n=1 Tax=Novosphingobium sp. TaxID=1874826 RepID=UPI0032BCCDB6